MKTLLIWPKSRNEVLGWGDLGAIAEPLALEYLGAGLKQDGHEVRILDLRLHADDLDDVIRSYRPDLVGLTAFSMHVRSVLDIARHIKAALPDCRIVAGGHHATFLPEDFLIPEIDFVVSGDGTGPIRRIAEAVDSNAPCPEIPGTWVRDGSGHRAPKVARNFSRDDINAILPPDRSLTAADREHYFIDWMRPVALLRTSTGCPYRCTFCSIWKVTDGHYITRDADPVVAELRTIQEECVFLVDDEAFINRGRMLELAEKIREAGIRKRFFTYCRIDTLLRNRDAVAAWRDIGLERLFIGVDAIAPKDLEEYDKRCNLSDIEAGLSLARELGIKVFAQFVVNTDYSERDFQRLVRFIEHHQIEYPSFTVLTPLPGTELLPNFDAVTETQPNGRPNWDLFDCQNPVTATRLPKPEFRRQYRNLYQVFKGAYTQYREHNAWLDERNPAERSYV